MSLYPIVLFLSFYFLLLSYFLLAKTVVIKFIIKINIFRIFNYIFLIATAFLLVLLAFNLYELSNHLAIICAIITSFFFPGYALLRLLKFNYKVNFLEFLLLIFVLSVGITSLLYIFILTYGYKNNIYLVVLYVCLSLYLLLTDEVRKLRRKEIEYYTASVTINFAEILVILCILLFFIFAISYLYPREAFRPGLDIVRHFSSALLLAMAPEIYSSNYPFFHATWAAVYMLSRPTMDVYQTALAYLSIMGILSFYILANIYLQDIDRRASILATLFFSIFSGFGWLFYLNLKITTSDISQYYRLLSESSNKSYWDIGYGQCWIWLWYRPLTLGLTLLFMLLYLLRNSMLNRKIFIIVFTLISITLVFSHFAEFIIFILFLFILNLLKPDIELRLKEANISSFLALLISFILNIILTISSLSLIILLTLTMMVAISIFLQRLNKKLKINFASHLNLLTISLTIIYVWFIMAWLISAKDFSVTHVSDVLGVPWHMYPVLLGLPGLLSIPASFLVMKYYPRHPVKVFIYMIIFIIIFGRLITFLNIYAYYTGYWERRFVPIAYAASSILAPIFILKILGCVSVRKNNILVILLIYFAIISGITSTFLTIDLQDYYTMQFSLREDDKRSIKMLDSLPPNKVLLTVTDESLSIAEFVPNRWLINVFRYPIWSAKYPELPLYVLHAMTQPVYIFLREADLREINKKYKLGYINNHFLQPFMKCTSSNNSLAKVISLPYMTAPAFSSVTMLVLPKEYDRTLLYSYDILSLANYNYTTVLIDDIASLSDAETLIAPSEELALKLIKLKKLCNLKFKHLIILNINGYGELALNYFKEPRVKLTLNNNSENVAVLLVNGLQTNSISMIAAPLEIEIRALANGTFFALLDDSADGWVSIGMGSGNISAPKIDINYENKAIGNASISINVGPGKYSQWQIAKIFPQPINVDGFDFISFYWYGRGDGREFVILFYSGSSDYYWYSFRDTWYGWKKVLIPMRIPNGCYVLNGVHFCKNMYGNSK